MKHTPLIPIATNARKKRQTNFAFRVLVITFIRGPCGVSECTSFASACRSICTLGHLLLHLGSRAALFTASGDSEGLTASVADGVGVRLLHFVRVGER